MKVRIAILVACAVTFVLSVSFAATQASSSASTFVPEITFSSFILDTDGQPLTAEGWVYISQTRRQTDKPGNGDRQWGPFYAHVVDGNCFVSTVLRGFRFGRRAVFEFDVDRGDRPTALQSAIGPNADALARVRRTFTVAGARGESVYNHTFPNTSAMQLSHPPAVVRVLLDGLPPNYPQGPVQATSGGYTTYTMHEPSWRSAFSLSNGEIQDLYSWKKSSDWTLVLDDTLNDLYGEVSAPSGSRVSMAVSPVGSLRLIFDPAIALELTTAVLWRQSNYEAPQHADGDVFALRSRNRQADVECYFDAADSSGLGVLRAVKLSFRASQI